MAQQISECCGAAAKDPVMLDLGICPECKDHCEFIDESKYDQKRLLIEIMNEDEKNGLYEPVTNNHTLTAVEWLFNMLWKTPQYETEWQELYKQAKQMEKKQIYRAWNSGYNCYDIDEELEIKQTMFSAEKHYNDTYKKD